VRGDATLQVVPDITQPMEEERTRRFDRLFGEHRRAVLGYALRRADDPADAADVLAETFLIAWRRLDDVPFEEGARAWLLGVARRVLANQRRGARRHSELAERIGRELATQLAQVPEPSETDMLVLGALATLSEDDREVLLLAGWEGLSPSEIAAAMGLRAVTVRSRLHRARRRLRAALDAPGPVVDAPATLDLAAKEPCR
jgi:RNA polymerase sigma factor (sigma-70 family)